MSPIANPALAAFITETGEELLLAEVLICRTRDGFELRHASDRSKTPDSLRPVTLEELRQLSQFTSGGAFRPLKSAPTLQTGWRISVHGAVELGIALSRLYPGALADWCAARSGAPPITHYREFTARQTGMYRVTTKLSDAQVGQVISLACDKSACLKRRLWSIPGVEPDPASEKSLIPCLEPCALLLEFARKAVRLDQQEGKISGPSAE